MYKTKELVEKTRLNKMTVFRLKNFHATWWRYHDLRIAFDSWNTIYQLRGKKKENTMVLLSMFRRHFVYYS